MFTLLLSKRRRKNAWLSCVPCILLRYTAEKSGWGDSKRSKEREAITRKKMRERQQKRDGVQENEKWKKWRGEGRTNLGSK